MKNFTKLGSKLQANQSQMARNLHVIERKFSSTDRLSGSRSERSLTSEEASIQHPLSIHSASIEHPLGVGGNQVATRPLSRIWKYAAMMALLLTLACGQMWGTEYTFINQSTGKYTGDFYTGRAESNVGSSSMTIHGLSCSYRVNFSSTGAPGVPNTDRYIKYDVKTTTTQIIVYFYNNNSSSNRSIKLGEFKEGKGSGETVREKSIAAKTGDTLIYNASNTTNSTIYITVPSNAGDVYFYQVRAIESGTALKKVGEDGYELDFNKGRVACKNGETTIIDGITISKPTSDYTAASGTSLALPKNAPTASYLSFTTPATLCNLKLTWSGSGQMAYNTSASASGATNITSGTEYGLSASTKYYLVNTSSGSGTTISKLEFTAPKDYTVTAATSTGTNTYGTVAASASSLDEGETTTITATPAAGYQVSNWAVSGTGASISPSGASNSNTTTLTMGSANATVTVTFEKVYASGTYNFVNQGDGSVTWGSSHTVTLPAGTKTTVPAGSRVDNIFFSTALDIEYEKGAEEGTGYKGWKIKQSGKLAFYVENDCDVIVTNGIINGMKIHYYNQSNVETNTNLTSTAGTCEETAHVKGGTLFEIVSTTTSTNTLKGIRVSSSCTAPTAVYVTQTAGSSDMVAGESFTLSAATSTGVEDGATYQWYRGSTEVGTNSPIFTVASCTAADAGTYWCKITNPCSSDAHTTNTVGFGIKVWQVLLYKDSWNAYDLTSTGTKTGEVTRQLTPGTYYIKLTHNNGVDFGVNTGSTISEITATTPTAWTLYNGQNNIKVTVTTAGDYTFGVNYTSADNPTLSVTYPPSTISSCDKIYFCPTENSIAKDNAKFSIYFYNDNSETGWANCYLVDGTEFADDAKYVAYAPATTNGWKKMIVVRDDEYASSFSGIWNQSHDITYNGYNYIVGTGWSDGKFTTNPNSFYSSTTPAMDESEYCVIVGGTTTASTNLPSSAVTYTSSDETKATVGSTTGVITGVAAGTATITAKVGTCTVGTATVTVYAAPSVVLSSSSVTYGASAPTLTPSNFATITGYSSLTTGTATINGSGVISIAGAGTTTFTVTGTDQCGNSVNVTTGTFTVNKADISPSLSYTSTTLTYGGGNSSTPTISGNTGSGTVTYSVSASSPSGCATVNESTGVVTPVSAGAATITATIAATTNYNGGTATTNFTINKATPTKYDFSVDKTTLCGEETATLTLEDSEDGVTYELRSDATHSIADTQKAGTGSALAWTGLGAGNYVVYAVETANYEERQMNSSKITVTTGTATSITTQPTNQEVTVDEEATLTVVAAGTSLTYQWKESATEDGTYSNVASGGTSSSYSVTPAAAGTKWYKCVVTGTCGTETTAARKIVANAAVTYTVTYDAQGGSVTPTSEDVSTATLPTPTKTDYTFQGWYTSSGTLISGTYNPTADITLHALWREDACAGGGGGSTTIFSISGMSWSAYSAANTTITIYPTGTPDKTYTATLVGASTVSVVNTNAESRTMLGKNSIKIGSNDVSMRFTLTSGTLQNGDVISFTNSGENQLSFTTTATRSTTPATTSDTYTIAKDDGLAGSSSLYVWRPSSTPEFTEFTITRAGGSGTCYYVTYNGNGADGGFTKDEASHASGSNVTVASNSFTKTGYTFTGWKTEPSGGTSYTAGGTISGISGNMTLYAQWIESGSTYDITYNCNDATSGCPEDAEDQTALPDPLPSAPTKTNYSFGGWYTDEGLSDAAVAGATLDDDAVLYAKWTQTVTLNTGSQGSGSVKTPTVVWQATALNGFSAHTADGYTLQGYYTAGSGGVKVLNANGSFAAANVTDYITSSKWSRTGAAPTLFAQWRAAGGASCNTIDHISDFPSSGSTGMTVGNLKVTYSGDKVSRTTATIYSGKTGCNVLKIGGSGTGQYVQGYLGGNEISSLELGVEGENSKAATPYCVAFSASSTFDDESVLSWSALNSQKNTNTSSATSDTLTSITVPSGAKYFRIYRKASFNSIELGAGSSVYVWHIKACTAGASTHTITYANGGGTGTMTSDADIADDGTQILKTNTFTAPTNYSFAGWVADVDVTIGGSTVTAGTLIANGATITNITSDIALTAKWSQTITLDDNDANHGTTGDGSATVYYNATSLASITHTTAASGYKLAGYYTAATSGTKVLNSDGSFAGDDITDWIDDGKWVQNDDDEPLLYAQYEASGSIKWNLQVNSADAPIVTSSKNSSYTQISTSNMSNLTNSGLTVTASKKSELTSLISTPDTKGDDCMYVTFKVATGYKFTPSLIKAIIQPVGNGEHKAVEFSLADESSHTLVSGSATKCDGTEKGKKTTVTLAGNGTYFTGTVTLKIFVYKHADGTNSTAQYRLGTPIQIDGAVEATCKMPSYESVSYSQTEYTVGDTPSSISVEDATGDPTYQWKYNSTGDRSSGTNGVTTASMSPSTASAGTTYYWCELTNACGTVKTPAVAITVSESKSVAPSIAWTDPASTPNYGGGGYTLRATVNDASWDGSASGLTITAPAGIRIYNTTTGTDGSSKKYIEVKFDVQTAFDRETYSSNIPFTVSADATASYNAISADHNVSYSACSGGGGSATEELMAVDASHIDNSTWKGGWVYDGIGMMRYGHGSSDISAGTNDANLKDLSYTMASGDITKYYKSASNHLGFYTEKAITGIRLYVYTSNDNVTVSNVYVANSAYTSGTPSSGAVSYEAEYNDDNDALRSGTHSGSAWVDITFDEEVAAEKYGQINLSNNVNIAGMAFISASGSGATLTTTLAFATTGTIAKTQSAANFTNAASVTAYSETLGAITYSSSNTDCATVDSKTGEVTITASGASDQSTTITATLAASGCYKGATTTYTITVAGVSCTVNHGTLASDVTTKCSTADATLTLTGFDSGATVQWYKGESTIGNGATYAITTEGTTSTMVTKEVGTYSVMVTKDECSDRSNSITISNYSAEVAATKIVDKWYIKHGRVTPDIALWALDEGTHLDSVTWSTTNATGLTIADFYESDGVVYLSGKEPNTNESSDAEYTLTLRVKDECENKTLLNTSAKQITLTHQKNTDKHVLAFVVEGTAKGGFTAGISADQTTGVELYNEIAKTFDVQATNIYSTDDEQKLKEYYSQFDILCITDYPNTKTKGVNSKSYVDAIGAMVDIRPILTMEAWVSGLTNWKSKGISGTPKSPTTRQYSMLLQCKDHEIFTGTNPTTVGSGDETMYRIDMVDKTQEEYVTLDATYGAGAHESDKNYQYGKKPALQGFTYDASMSSLLPIGRIDDGEGNDLEVGVERQAVMEARLLVLGINGYAMERLDDDGQTIVINALKYLMKKNAEDISDCSNYFVGGAEGDPYSWKNLDNWSGSTLPDRTQEVRIVAPCVISDTIARASSVKIVTGGTYSHGTKTANGSLTINPTGSLIVDGKIYAATAPNFFEKRTTEPENLIVKADADHTGTLIFDNEDGETQATIEMYSKSYWETVEGKYKKYWSYVGMPIKDVHIPEYFYGAFTYYYNETKGWERRFDNDIMQPFEGIGLSMQTGHKETFYGTMVSTENVDIKLTSTTGYGDGDNLIGNSWTAPIQIANFDASDFGDALATIYIFNTGREGNTYVDASVENKGVAKAGQWLGVPISVAGLEEYTGLKVVPAMNAFLVYNDEGAGTTTTMHLDYEKLVRDGASSNTQINEPMRAPSAKTKKKKDVEGLLRIRVAGEKTNTDVWMMQDPRFSEAFDNGWEAYYTTCDDRSAQLYARSSTGKMSFLALPDLDGTVLGFAPSRDGNNYTFTFQYRGEDEYYLNDLKLQQSVLINADNTYDFIYEKGDANRFYISRTPLQAPQTPTGIGNTEGTSTQSTKAIKVIYNDQLYIIRGGRVYSADGSLVK